MNKKKITIVGADGKMGQMLCERLKNTFEIYKVTKDNSVDDFTDSNLIIDFSVPEQSLISANYCKSRGIPLILGTTGQTESQIQQLNYISKSVPIFFSSNFSLGIKILSQLLLSLKPFLNDKNLDIIITEKHHKDKIDSPSGTALFLKNILENELKSPVQINCVRGGKEIGTHKIDIYFNDEIISLSHKAFSRNAFLDEVISLTKKILS